MSTVDRPEPRVLPPLVEGQYLDQPTFHERYEAMPPGTWAELIGGIVHLLSPLFEPHSDIDGDVGLWLSHYRRFTKGLRSPRNVSTILGRKSDYGSFERKRWRPAAEGLRTIRGLIEVYEGKVVQAQVEFMSKDEGLAKKLAVLRQVEAVLNAADSRDRRFCFAAKDLA